MYAIYVIKNCITEGYYTNVLSGKYCFAGILFAKKFLTYGDAEKIIEEINAAKQEGLYCIEKLFIVSK
jgi:hypothetical protein